MADHHDRAGEALQPGLQPDQGVQVQVVGGFVEQQQVGRAHQRAGELQAHAPAAGEAVDRRLHLLGLEAQAHQQGLRAGAGVEAADLADLHVRVGHRVAVLGGLGGGQLALCLHQREVAFEHEVGGRIVGLGHVLRDLAQAPARGNLEVARVGLQPSGQQREQAGLAGAVAPDQAHLLARVHVDVDAVEDDLGAAAQLQITERDHFRKTWEGRIL